MLSGLFSSPLLISYAIQALLIVHCLKTGRNTLWIWVLMLLPLAGPLAYLVVEVLPELSRSRGATRAARGMRRVIDPGRDLRRLEPGLQQPRDLVRDHARLARARPGENQAGTVQIVNCFELGRIQ